MNSKLQPICAALFLVFFSAACGSDTGTDVDASSTQDGDPGAADADPNAADADPDAPDADTSETDASLDTADASAEEGVECGDQTCGSESECCLSDGSASCVEPGTCEGGTYECTSPDDCTEEDEVCCQDGSGAVCTAESNCDVRVCDTKDDCPDSQECCPTGFHDVCVNTCPGPGAY